MSNLGNYHVSGYADELTANAAHLATPGKGILCAFGLINLAFEAVCALNAIADSGALQYYNGVILPEEALALYQTTPEGRPDVDICKEHGVLPGIMADFERGSVELAGDLAISNFLLPRGRMYYEAGARFATHRVVLKIGPNEPSEHVINEKARELAKFAFISQASGLVPIVYPEIQSEGSHGIEYCAFITEHVLATCLKAFKDHHVLLEGAMFMINTVTPGLVAPNVAPEVVASHTVKALQRTLPPAVPGVFFSSNYGNMLNLNAMNQVQGEKPWTLSFFPEEGALEAWVENEKNVLEALKTMAKANSEAALGKVDVGEGASNCNYIMLGAVYALGIVLVYSMLPL